MKIHLDNVDFSSNSGPNTFSQRLAMAFFENGHEIVFNGLDADISLVFIQKTGASLAKKVVQRLDGIWSKPNDIVSKNIEIQNLYNNVDGVIHQSNFDKTFIEGLWGSARKSCVINNGINAPKIKKFSSAAIEQLRSNYEQVFVCSAHWHRQKRLKENIDCFKHLRNLTGKKSCLIVMGNNPDCVISDKDIFYTSSLPHETCLEIFSASDWMIHLAWRDHCPNTVVECLSQNTPVICSSDSGTIELVGKFGLCLNENIVNNLLPYDYDNPPEIDVTQIKTLDKTILDSTLIDVSMETCVKKYISFFESIL